MKRKPLALLLCAYLIITVLAVRLSMHATGNTTETATETSDRMDIVATQPPVWRSFEDYLVDEGMITWNDKDALVGATATFNIAYVQDFIFASEATTVQQLDYLEYPSLTNEEVLDANGKSIKVVITDYKFFLYDEEEETGDLWYKIEAAEGYELPQLIKDNPYVLHTTFAGDYPSLLAQPQMAMFTGDIVTLKKQAVAASAYKEIPISKAPAFVDVEFVDSGNYDLGDVTSWSEQSIDYRYVDSTAVILIPSEVSRAYNALMAAEGSSAFYGIFNSIPDEVLAQFTEAHKMKIQANIDHLVALENVEHNTSVNYNGTEINVSVKGKIPETEVTLQVEAVSDEDVMNGGFGIESADDIITALDIKFINNSDGTEWQPEKGFPVELSIDMAALGYEDGKIVQFHHKHGDRIDTYDIFVVMDGKVTFYTDSFSFYIVNELGNTNNYNSEQLNNTNRNNPYEIAVGDRKVFYYNANNNANSVGTWYVSDPSGAIHYTVYSESNIGNGGMRVRWIEVRALRETTEPITLNYKNTSGANETHYLSVVSPKATNTNNEYQNNGRRLYIKDLVNSSGTIAAALVDTEGNDISETGLAGASYSWTRDDGLFIVPQAYGVGYKSVDIARDHGGLVEARKDDDGYNPVTYTLTVTLSDGVKLKKSYTVYYQSEIINAGFEFPLAQNNTYTFFPNGYPELYWKTTAQGTGNNISKDVEYGDVTSHDSSEFGVSYAGDWKEGGTQFAELNAEAFGSLYQDIITVPSTATDPEEIEWNFAHAPRTPSWSNSGAIKNKMFIIIGATEDAQKLTSQSDLKTLGDNAKKAAEDQGTAFYNDFMNCKVSIEVTDKNGAKYRVWYHDADPNKEYYNSQTNNYGWSYLGGTYTVPQGQYRTRVFFVTDASQSASGTENGGNLIDISQAGQYKHYLIEYYEETYVDGKLQIKYYGTQTEDDEALIYSSVKLQNFDDFETIRHDFLHKIVINGNNYPYDIRYSTTNDALLYIEKYPVNSEKLVVPDIDIYETDNNGNNIVNKNYEDYDIVMQVYFRDTVVAVDKNLILPSKEYNSNGVLTKDGMSEEQKLTLMEELNKAGGYKTSFILSSTDNPNFTEETDDIYITNRDPAGNYKGYVAMGDNLQIQTGQTSTYKVKELMPKDPEGLILANVRFEIKRYALGVGLDEKELIPISYDISEISPGTELAYTGIVLGDEIDVPVSGGGTKKGYVKIVDVTVTNYYDEKMTTIYYKAVGNGKVAITPEPGQKPNFLDTPTEQLAYYSGVADGASVFAGAGATFMGWFKDEACTDPVTSADGVWDSQGNFRPNANILYADEVTFYAKFVTNSIEINRTNGIANDTYIYKVERLEGGSVVSTMYVTLTCDKDGNGKTTILEATNGTYRVTELDKWTWRHPDEASQTKTHSNVNGASISFTFSQKHDTDEWLSGFSPPEKNVYGEA